MWLSVGAGSAAVTRWAGLGNRFASIRPSGGNASPTSQTKPRGPGPSPLPSCRTTAFGAWWPPTRLTEGFCNQYQGSGYVRGLPNLRFQHVSNRQWVTKSTHTRAARAASPRCPTCVVRQRACIACCARTKARSLTCTAPLKGRLISATAARQREISRERANTCTP